MTTCRDIIKRAYQMVGIVALGEEPTAEEAEYGLEVLQTMYDGWVERGMFGRLKDVYKTANYTAQEGERVITPAATITLPTTIDDGEVRAPRNLSCIVKIVAGVQTSHVYHRGQWVTLGGLALASDAPFAERGAIGLAACVAQMMGDTFAGAAVGDATVRMANQFKGGLSYKLGSTQPTPEGAFY